MAIDWNNLYGTTGAITRTSQRGSEGVENFWTSSTGQRYDDNPFASFAGTGWVPLTSLADSPERVQGMLQAGTFTEDALRPDDKWGYMVDQSKLQDIDSGFSLKDAAMVFAPLAMTVAPYMLAGSALGGAGATAGATGAAGAGGAAGTFGSIPTQFGWESFLSGGELAGMGAGAPTLGAGTAAATGATGGGMSSIWDTISNFFTPSPTSVATQAATSGGEGGSFMDAIMKATTGAAESFVAQPKAPIDWTKALMSLGTFFQNKSLADKYAQIAQQSADRSDPFASQRGLYQNVLAQSYLDPNFLMNNPTFKAMLDPALRQTQANLARRGLTSSGNALHEIMRTGTETAAKYMLPFQAQTGQLAGAGFSPTYSGFLQQQGAQLGAQTNNTALSQLGVLADIFKPQIQSGINTGIDYIKNWLV